MRFLRLSVLAASFSHALAARGEPVTEVVVQGYRDPRPSREPTLAASRIDERELARPGAHAAQVLNQVPGVQTSEAGGSADLQTASVRGATSAQTPVYLAGIRLNDDVTGAADLSLIPLWMLSRAEVYRGNAPADADHLGIGGAVYFEPRRPTRNRLGAGLEVGSFARRAGFVAAELAHRRAGALVAFRTGGADNDYPYRDARGDDSARRPNANYGERDAWAIGRTALSSRAELTTVVNAFEREQGISALSARPALSARGENARLLLGVSARLGCAITPGCDIELASQFLSSRSRIEDPRRELGLFSERLDSKGTRFGQTARLRSSYGIFRAFLAANVEFERFALDHDAGANIRVADDRRRASRRTASTRLGLSAVPNEDTVLSVLGLLSREDTSGPERDSVDLNPEGRVGILHKLGALELRSNFGRYVRAPTLGELYGVSALVRGNSSLLAERGVAFDAGARVRSLLGPVSVYIDAFAFARDVSRLVAYERSSFGAIEPFNVGRARFLGAEFEAGARWERHARAVLSLTVLDPRDTTSGRTLTNDLVPYQSRLFGSLFVQAFLDPESSWVERAGLDARIAHRGSRFSDPAGLVVLPASTELDLGANVWFGPEPAVSVRAAIDDVFDDRRYDFIGYPVPGRRLAATLEAWW